MYTFKKSNHSTKPIAHLLGSDRMVQNRVLSPVVLTIKLNGLKGTYNYLLSIIILIASMEVYFLKSFMHFIDQRQGIILQDWILDQLPSYDLSAPIFILIYTVIALMGIQVLRDSELFIKGMAGYTLLLAFRYITLYLVKLDPPAGVVLLRDPFLETLVYTHYIPVKDLFFSGHTATLTLCSLVLKDRMRVLSFIITAVVAAMLLIQHAHYVIDVLAAPIFAVTAYQIAFRSSLFNYLNQSFEDFHHEH